MEDERENDKPSEPVKDTDPGARARSGIKYNPGWTTPTPLPNPYGIEQTYGTPYYAAEGGVTHMAEGGMAYGGSTSGSIDTKSQFADYLNKVMNPTNRTNAVSGSTNPYEWWKSPSTPATPAAPPAETAEEYAARARANARGSSGGQSQEQRDQREADLDRVDDYLSTPENQVTMRQYWAMDKEARDKLNADAAERNPIRGAIYEGVTKLGYPMFLRGAEALQGVIKDFMGPSTNDPKSVGMVFPTEKDRIKAEEAAKYRQALLGDTSLYINNVGENQNVGPGTPEFNAARQAAIPSAGPNMYIGSSLDPYSPIDRVTATDAANAAYQRAQADAAEKARMQLDTFSRQEGDIPAALSRQERDVPDAVAQTNAVLSRQMNDIPAALSRQERDVLDKSYDLSGSPYAPFFSKDRDYAPRTTGFTTPEVGTPISRNTLQTQYTKGEPAIGDPRAFPLSADALSTPYDQPGIQALVEQQQPDVNDLVTLRAIKEIYGVDSPIAKDVEAKATHNYDNLNNQINNFVNTREFENAERGDRYPNLPYQVYRTSPYESNFLSRQEKDVPIAAPDIVGTENEIKAEADPNADNYAQILNAFDRNNTDVARLLSEPGSLLAAGPDYTGGIPDGSSLAGYQGMYNPGYATPNMGYYSNNQGGRGLGVPGFGGVWRSSEGVPIRTGDGSSLQTGEGAQQESSNDRVERIMREAQEANPGGGGNGSDNNGAGVHEGGYSNSLTRSNDQGDGGGANGGLSTPYGFQHMANGGLSAMATPYNLGSYSDGGRLLKGPGDGVSDSIPATIGKGRPARLADGEFVIPARIVSEIGNGSTEAGARKLYAMMDRIQASRSNTVGKGKVAVNNRADKYLPA
jgi:hypothetical protein